MAKRTGLNRNIFREHIYYFQLCFLFKRTSSANFIVIRIWIYHPFQSSNHVFWGERLARATTHRIIREGTSMMPWYPRSAAIMTYLTNKHWDHFQNAEKRRWHKPKHHPWPKFHSIYPLASSQTLDLRWTSRRIILWGSPILSANHTTTALFLQSPGYSRVPMLLDVSSSPGFLQSGTHHILHLLSKVAFEPSCGYNFKNHDI